MLLSTSHVAWYTGAKRMALCLVLKKSSRLDGAFERIGVMYCDLDDGIFRSGENHVIELV
jgi:hypothetical protein